MEASCSNCFRGHSYSPKLSTTMSAELSRNHYSNEQVSNPGSPIPLGFYLFKRLLPASEAIGAASPVGENVFCHQKSSSQKLVDCFAEKID
jgi:hypothetical protein